MDASRRPTLFKSADPSRKPHRTLVLEADGSISRLLVQLLQMLAQFAVLDEVLAGIFANWNEEVERIAKHVPRGVRVFIPPWYIPGYRQGFLDEPDNCRRAWTNMEPVLRGFWAEAERLSSSFDLAGAVVVKLLSPAGGHMPIAQENEKLARQHFPNALQVNLLPLPTADRGLWPNLAKYRDYPPAGTPTVIFRNDDWRYVNWAVTWLFSILLHGHRFTDRGQPNVGEVFQRLIRVSPVMGLAAASAKVPILPRKWYHIVLGRDEGVHEKDAQYRVAEAVVRALQDDAKLIAADIDPSDPQVLAVGGLPVPATNDAYLTNLERFKRDVRLEVDRQLEQLGQEFPPGLKIVYSHTVDQTPDRFVLIPAIRLWPIRGRTARDFVDAMLGQEALSAGGLIRSPAEPKALPVPNVAALPSPRRRVRRSS